MTPNNVLDIFRIPVLLIIAALCLFNTSKVEAMPEAVGIDLFGPFSISPEGEFTFLDIGDTLPADGVSYFFFDVLLLDANGDILNDWRNEVASIEVTGSAIATIFCYENNHNGMNDGSTSCEPQITNTVAETVAITFTLNGTEYNFGNITFRTASVINNTTISQTGSLVPDADGVDSTTLNFQLNDINNEPLMVGGDTLFVTTTGDAELSAVTDNEDGTYSVTVTNTTIETVDLSLNINNVDSFENIASITFRSTPIAANTTFIQTGSISPDTDGVDSTTFTFQLNDSNNSPTTVGGDQVTVSSTGTAVVSPVVDNNDGTYSVNITNTVAETVSLSIEVNGTLRPNIASITFNGGQPPEPPAGPADAFNTIVSVSGANLEANGTDAWNVTIQLVDTNNNELSIGGDDVEITTTSNAAVSDVVDNGNGSYSVSITNTTAEIVALDLSINGTSINNIVSTTFFAGAIDPTQTQITSTNNEDGSVDLSIQLADANGNPITTGGADIIVNTTGSASTNGVTDNGDGTYLVTVTNAAGGSTDISLTINGQASGTVLSDLTIPGEPEPDPEPVTPLNVGGGGGSLNWLALLLLGLGLFRKKIVF